MRDSEHSTFINEAMSCRLTLLQLNSPGVYNSLGETLFFQVRLQDRYQSHITFLQELEIIFFGTKANA